MTYWMYAIREDKTPISYKGDSGNMSMALWQDETGEIHTENSAKPRVGVAMRVGSIYARSFSHQDWWQTTLIVDIVEEWTDDENNINIIFNTKNSTYHWKEF